VVEVAGQVVVTALAQEQFALLGAFAHDIDRPTSAVQVFESHSTKFGLAHARVEQRPEDGANFLSWFYDWMAAYLQGKSTTFETATRDKRIKLGIPEEGFTPAA